MSCTFSAFLPLVVLLQTAKPLAGYHGVGWLLSVACAHDVLNIMGYFFFSSFSSLLSQANLQWRARFKIKKAPPKRESPH